MYNGAYTIIEKVLGRDLLHLACRHHVYELPLKNVFEKYFGKTKSPEVALFKKFQKSWVNKEIDQIIFESRLEDDEVFSALISSKENILSFAILQLKVFSEPSFIYKSVSISSDSFKIFK